ncbi:hypothetical protein [Nostoc sp.]|uniref:hypothetical protein n=1 Tax=Nostoc sp. TaxID=1180 RepID=UPI002FFBE722
MSHLQLIWLSSAIALLGTGMLTLTAVIGNLLTSHKNQKFQLARGQIFKYHRLISILGVVLILIHPIPLVFAQSTTGVSVASIFVPFLAEKKITIIAVGVIALYVLLVIKKLGFKPRASSTALSFVALSKSPLQNCTSDFRLH